MAHTLNQNKQLDNGIELESKVKLNTNISIHSFYTYTTGQIHMKLPTGNDTSFNNLLRRPKNLFQLSISISPNKRMIFEPTVQIVGKRNDIYFDANTFTNKTVTLNSYSLINLYAAYKLINNKFTIYVDGRNILNKTYYEVVGYNSYKFNMYFGIKFEL